MNLPSLAKRMLKRDEHIAGSATGSRILSDGRRRRRQDHGGVPLLGEAIHWFISPPVSWRAVPMTARRELVAVPSFLTSRSHYPENVSAPDVLRRAALVSQCLLCGLPTSRYVTHQRMPTNGVGILCRGASRPEGSRMLLSFGLGSSPSRESEAVSDSLTNALAFDLDKSPVC